MTRFTFDASHFDTLTDCLWEGYIAKLAKPNRTILEISQHMTDEGDHRFNICVQTPGGLELKALDVFSYGDLFDFLEGLVFDSMDFIEK